MCWAQRQRRRVFVASAADAAALAGSDDPSCGVISLAQVCGRRPHHQVFAQPDRAKVLPQSRMKRRASFFADGRGVLTVSRPTYTSRFARLDWRAPSSTRNPTNGCVLLLRAARACAALILSARHARSRAARALARSSKCWCENLLHGRVAKARVRFALVNAHAFRGVWRRPEGLQVALLPISERGFRLDRSTAADVRARQSQIIVHVMRSESP